MDSGRDQALKMYVRTKISILQLCTIFAYLLVKWNIILYINGPQRFVLKTLFGRAYAKQKLVLLIDNKTINVNMGNNKNNESSKKQAIDIEGFVPIMIYIKYL